jgi:hypothetical protein
VLTGWSLLVCLNCVWTSFPKNLSNLKNRTSVETCRSILIGSDPMTHAKISLNVVVTTLCFSPMLMHLILSTLIKYEWTKTPVLSKMLMAMVISALE